MLEAALWGFVGGIALLLGAAIALSASKPISDRAIAFVMAFGAGVLISAVTLDLTEEALSLAGGDVTAIGLAAGALGYELLGDASANALATVNAFAAGAILCMLADTMMPKAFRDGGDRVGLVTVAGFALAAVLTTI